MATLNKTDEPNGARQSTKCQTPTSAEPKDADANDKKCNL